MTTPARPRARAALTASLALALGTALALGPTSAASAHVTLDENTAEAGSYALLTFKVPGESETATTTTTSVTVQLPTDTPFASVRTVPVAGWQAEIVVGELPEPVEIGDTTLTEAATAIVWTATGAGIGDGELGLFPFSVGPVPDVGRLELPVDQGYSDGSVVPWDGDDVPVLYVNDAPADHHGEQPEDAVAAAPQDGTALAGVVLGSGGLLLGAAALVLTLVRRRSA
jgi:uncharacterized protein YcnI